MARYAWLIPLLPAVSAAIIAMIGKYLPAKGAEVGIAAVAAALVISGFVAAQVWPHNAEAVHAYEESHAAEEEHASSGAGVQVASVGTSAGLLGTESTEAEEHAEEPAAADEHGEEPAETGEHAEAEGAQPFVYEGGYPIAQFDRDVAFDAGIRVDGLTVMMFLLVTFVSLMVHIYSTGYMHGDPRFTYFYVLLSLFTASMLLLVIANNILLMLVGWELVGVCSFLLIGFWWEEKANSNAAIKAFLTTKFGDVGLMVGVITLFWMFRTFDIGAIIASVHAGTMAGGQPLNMGILAFGLISLFIGGVGKSAQFPLHPWLPDAMAGPTPVSALIHAATMVTSGIFLIARLYPVFAASDVTMAVVAVIGSITLIMAGLLALVQDDVKKVLAYSTVSQLGYMIAALAFSYTAGIFHLFTHGFFKALLFLGAGSLIHAVHSNNMSDMGGLRKYMPYTFVTFVIGSLALAAVFPLAGFWSKDEVLAGGFDAGGYTGYLLLGLGLIGGMITAFYMARVLWLVFGGSYRGHGHPHESPASMKWPLVVLAFPAALIGLINLPFEGFHHFGLWTTYDFSTFHAGRLIIPVAAASLSLAIIGLAIGTLMYRRAPASEPMLKLGLFSKVLVNKYYLDRLETDLIARTLVRDKLATAAYWFNDNVIDKIVFGAGVAAGKVGRGTYNRVDQRGIDGVLHGLAGGAGLLGREVFRKFQSGNVQLYAGGMFVGVFVLAVLFAAAA
jgi:NADH-quinone oxidoreductase subunit L